MYDGLEKYVWAAGDKYKSSHFQHRAESFAKNLVIILEEKNFERRHLMKRSTLYVLISGVDNAMENPHRVEAAVSGMFLKPRDCQVVEGGPELVQSGVSNIARIAKIPYFKSEL